LKEKGWFLLRIGHVLAAVTLLPVLLMSPMPVGAASLQFVWPASELTWRRSEQCGGDWLPWISQALAAWQSWVPQLSFREVNATTAAAIEFSCYNMMVLPWGLLGDVITYYQIAADGGYRVSSNGFPIADRVIVEAALGSEPFTLTHELGHVLGLSDRDCQPRGDGDLMCGRGGLWAGSRIITPAPGEVEALQSYYAAVPVAEFPTPIIWLMISLFAFWTPIMRREARRKVKSANA
jgi:hypothetical protein